MLFGDQNIPHAICNLGVLFKYLCLEACKVSSSGIMTGLWIHKV